MRRGGLQCAQVSWAVFVGNAAAQSENKSVQYCSQQPSPACAVVAPKSLNAPRKRDFGTGRWVSIAYVVGAKHVRGGGQRSRPSSHYHRNPIRCHSRFEYDRVSAAHGRHSGWRGRGHHERPRLLNAISMARSIAGCAGFLILTHSRQRPER